MIKLEKIAGGYKVIANNGVYMGEFLVSDSGWFDWWPEFPSKGGYYSSDILKQLIDKLDELNQPYNDEVRKFFDSPN